MKYLGILGAKCVTHKDKLALAWHKEHAHHIVMGYPLAPCHAAFIAGYEAARIDAIMLIVQAALEHEVPLTSMLKAMGDEKV
jgi:hypothetical protein